ncbi:MAG TPA: alpha/beta hydrolase [Verrucomicrobiae bacterium]|nr:alpha/beta hydrolase [Verrucomicrobiae bacterium]
MLRWFEHRQVYQPSRFSFATGSELGRPFENVFFHTRDNVRLHGWFFPANANSPRAALALLFCHGNGGNICHRLQTAQALLATGLNVFLFDYRGYGQSQGRPSEEGTYVDGMAAYEWLRQKGFAGCSILLYGESLGGGVAAELGLRLETAGLILQSTFTSLPALGAELFPWLPVQRLARIRYDTLRKLPQFKRPVLILHSPQDELVAFHHAQQNFAAGLQPKLLWEIKGRHNDPLADTNLFITGIEQFLRLIEPPKTNVNPHRV